MDKKLAEILDQKLDNRFQNFMNNNTLTFSPTRPYQNITFEEKKQFLSQYMLNDSELMAEDEDLLRTRQKSIERAQLRQQTCRGDDLHKRPHDDHQDDANIEGRRQSVKS